MTRTRPATRPARPLGSGPAVTLAVVPSAEGAAITGPIADVTALLEHLRETGADLAPLSAHELRITLPVAPATLRPFGRSWRNPVRERPGLALAAGLALVTGAGLVFLIWLAVAWLLAHLAVIAAVLVALAALAVLTGAGACTTVIKITHRH